MSWLRSSPLRASFNKQRSRDSPPKDADPSACYDSFCKHWQQTYEIIQRTTPPNGKPNQDDVLGVVNHIDQMVTLLVLELRDTTFSHTYRPTTTATHSPCLEYLLSENLLVKLYEWSLHTGRFNNAVRLEELKLHELLVSHSGTLLAHEPVARPLLWLLDECANDIMPVEVEKKLVVLLNHLCVALMQNMALLDLFFHSTPTGKSKFIIFTLLIPHVHREGAVGQQARDAMLLCMSLSKKNDAVGLYIADHSNICPVLATGLSGLYSLLPRKLDIETDDWHRLTPDDVNDLPAVTQLMNSLEFCNAVAQVAHPTVQKQLLEFLYQGFLVPVMGPALLQDSFGLTLEQLDAQQNRTTVEELVAATAYFDLFLRSVTEPGLLRSLVKFLLEDNYDECRILDSLIQRMSSRSRLCIVTLALFETLVNLNCEDVMLELCLAALNPCSHVMFSQRRRLKDIDPFGRAAEKFLSLTPSCCALFPIKDPVSNSLPNTVFSAHDRSVNIASDTLKSLSLVNYSTKLTESLYGNYHAYLCDARQKITACRIACSNWSCQYNGEVSKSSSTSGIPILIEENKSSHISSKKIISNTAILTDTSKHANVAYSIAANPSSCTILEDSASILIDNKGNCEDTFTNTEYLVPLPLTLCTEEQAKLDADIADLLNESNAVTEFATEPSLSMSKKDDNNMNDSNTALNSLLSFGESSGYESFAFKGSYESTPDNEPDEEPVINHEESESESSPELNPAQNIMNVNSTLIGELISNKKTKEAQRQDIFNGEPNVGIFLDVILRKLECMTSNNLYVNLHLTGLISRLAIYPQPLLQSFLLNHSLVFQPSVRSLFQVLASLKHKIDQFLSSQADVDVLVEEARSFLIGREDRLVHARKNLLEAAAHTSKRNSSTSDPFSRGESKRKSLTSSFTQMFKRSSSGSGPSSLSTSVNEQSSLSENQIEITGFRTSYRRYHPRISWESPDKISPIQNVILCAVLLDEWLKELAAITQEHAIISLTKSFEYKL